MVWREDAAQTPKGSTSQLQCRCLCPCLFQSPGPQTTKCNDQKRKWCSASLEPWRPAGHIKTANGSWSPNVPLWENHAVWPIPGLPGFERLAVSLTHCDALMPCQSQSPSRKLPCPATTSGLKRLGAINLFRMVPYVPCQWLSLKMFKGNTTPPILNLPWSLPWLRSSCLCPCPRAYMAPCWPVEGVMSTWK